MNDLGEKFLLNPEITFLNHGSFGATPRIVFERYQALQLELERQPVEFLARELDQRMDQARESLAKYLNASPLQFDFCRPTSPSLSTLSPGTLDLALATKF